MSSILTRIALPLAIVATAALSWGAQTPITLERLCKQAEHIVIGTVTKIDSYRAQWPRVGQVIFSDVTIRVEEEWKGKVKGRKLVLQVPGGDLPDGYSMRVSGAPVFRLGEKVLAFTAAYNKRQWVYGWEQGKYSVVVQRVVGKAGHPIAEDTLTYPLKKRIARLLKTRKEG